MDRSAADFTRMLGSAARLWARPGLHEVAPDWWVAFSGTQNVNYNLACCQSDNPEVLVERCLQPAINLGKPAIIMLAGPGLGTAQKLVDAGWVTVGALPLMILTSSALLPRRVAPGSAITAEVLSLEELPAARKILADTYGLDAATAEAAMPDRATESDDLRVWGLKDCGELVSCLTRVRQDGYTVGWSMATPQQFQGRGYGRQLLAQSLGRSFDEGVEGSLLHASAAGEKLYRSLGYTAIGHLQLWSRPRWFLARA